MPDDPIRDMLSRAERWRLFARLISDERTRQALVVTAAKLEQKAQIMRDQQLRSAEERQA